MKHITFIFTFFLFQISLVAQTVEEATQACLCLSDYAEADVPNTSLKVLDKWDRDVTLKGVTIPDWEGPMGNPEIAYQVVAPQGATYPLTVSFFVSDAPRVYFLFGGGGALKSEQSASWPFF